MRLDSGVCVKKISWLGWLCWSQTTIYVILSDIVLWSIFVFRFIFLLKQNYLSRGCFCLLHYRDHHLCRTLQFTKKCICFTICWCRYHSISQHNTTVLLYHATLKILRPPHSAQEADSSRQPCYEQDVKGENIWKISIYPKYLTNIIKGWLRRTNPKIVIWTPADRVHKISTKW